MYDQHTERDRLGTIQGLVLDDDSWHTYTHTPVFQCLTVMPIGVGIGGRSNLDCCRENVVLMIAFDFVIMAVIKLSRNLKYSAWKCSQIITIMQREEKIVFLSVQMNSEKNSKRPTSSAPSARFCLPYAEFLLIPCKQSWRTLRN